MDLLDPRVPAAGPDPIATFSAATWADFAFALLGQLNCSSSGVESLPSLLVGSLVETARQRCSTLNNRSNVRNEENEVTAQ